MKKFCLFLIAGIALCIITGISAPKAQALSGSQFKAGRIIDDAIFFQPNSMSASSVQTFLNAKMPSCDTWGTESSGHSGYPTRADWGRHNGYPPPYICLKSFKQNTPSVAADSPYCGALSAKSGRTAAQIITDISVACGVSPKTLIVLLQKEQGLVTDEWPWPSQYRIATGYGCPDTAPCDSKYYGFFNQVYNAAWQFKYDKAHPTDTNYVARQNNSILWNPNTACGRSTVYIENQATASLYNYTPYRPNAAALNNLYGTGDSCSAYGNRNFWRYFNDWFGPTLVGVIRAKSDDGSPTQYVIYDGKKQAIPSSDVLTAWGIDQLPLQTYSATAISNTPNQGTSLSRFIKSTTTGHYYFVDAGSYYTADNSATRALWNFPASTSTAGGRLFSLLNFVGTLTPYFSPEGSSTVAFIDGTRYFSFSNSSVRAAWHNGERIISLSTPYFNQLTSGGSIGNNRITAGGVDYAVVDQKRFTIPSDLNTTYPFSNAELSVSTHVPAYFTNAGDLKRFINNGYNSAVHFLNGGKVYGIPSTSIYDSYAAGRSKDRSYLGKDAFNLIVNGGTLRTTIVKKPADNTFYVLSDQVRKIPTGLEDNYSAATHSFALDNSFFTNLPISSQPATAFVTSPSNRATFLLDAGSRLGISNLTTLRQLKKTGEANTFLTDYDLGSYNYVKNISNYIGSSTQRYFIDQGLKHSTSSQMATEWGLADSSFTVVDVGTLADFTSSSYNLANTARIGTDLYLVTQGKRYKASSTYAHLWGLPTSNNLSLSSSSFFRVADGGGLNRFAARNSTIYTVDNGKLIGIPNLNALYNLGYTSQPIVKLSADLFAGLDSSQTFNGYFLKSAANTCYIADHGSKRVPNSASHNDWCYDDAHALSLTDSYLGLLTNGQGLTRSMHVSNNGGIYAIDNGTKRWIPNNTIYYKYFAPYSSVSKYLRDVLPSGSAVSSSGT